MKNSPAPLDRNLASIVDVQMRIADARAARGVPESGDHASTVHATRKGL